MAKTAQYHYLGPCIQNEIILQFGKAITSKIIYKVKKRRFFDILLDCTPDKSRKEQLSLVVCYVADGTDEGISAGIKEQFLCFIELGATTADHLYSIVKNKLLELGLDIKHCRGQGYDNGANMAGWKGGLQAKLKADNHMAFFVPCAAHNLNLVLSDMASKCGHCDFPGFFDNLAKLFHIFGISYQMAYYGKVSP